MFVINNKLLTNSFICTNTVSIKTLSEDQESFISVKEKGETINLYDLVYLENDNKIYKFSNNKIDKFVYGIVIGYDNLNTDYIHVLLMGFIEILSMSFSISRNIFMSENGFFTQTRPSGGYLHYLGTVIDEHTIFFKNNYDRIKQNPFW